MRRVQAPPRAQRILFVIGSARPAGAEGQMVRLACELHARGRDVFVAFQVFGGPLTDQLDGAGVGWQVMRPLWPPTSTGRNVASLIRLAATLLKFRPHVVCAWLPGAIWPALLLARWLTSAQRVAGLRGEVLSEDLRWQAPLFRSAMHAAHCVTVNTPTLRGTAQAWGAQPATVRFLSNGVDLPRARATVDLQPPRAVVVANFRSYKGHDCLIDAMSRVGRPLEVRLCGEGQERQRIGRRVAREGLQSRVCLVAEPADVAAELVSAQFAIHPSTTEGLSNAILEQLAHGLPVVATDVGGTSLLIRNEVNGLLVPSGDARQLAQAIEQLAGDPERRGQMSVAARVHAETFGWPACADAYAQLFDRLVAQGRGH